MDEAIWRDDSKHVMMTGKQVLLPTLLQIEEHAELYPEIKKQVEEDVWNYRWTRQDPWRNKLVQYCIYV